MAREICKNKKILYVWFRINGKNISKHAICSMKLNGLKEYYFNEIAAKDTQISQMCIEVMSWGHKSCVRWCFLDLKNVTFSQYHCHNKFRTIFDFKCFFPKKYSIFYQLSYIRSSSYNIHALLISNFFWYIGYFENHI